LRRSAIPDIGRTPVVSSMAVRLAQGAKMGALAMGLA
jgi:hypothetical protein